MFFKYNMYGLLWAAIMFALNMTREQNLPLQPIIFNLYFDKVAHFIEFALLTFLLVVGFSKQQTYVRLRFGTMQKVVLFSVVYALLLQGIQAYRLPQYFEFGDLLANLLGIAFGVAFFYGIYKYKVEN